MFRRRNRQVEQRVTEFRGAVMEQWDKLSGRDVDTLSDMLQELQALLEKRRKRTRVNLKPLTETVKRKPIVAALAGAALGLFVMFRVGRRHLEQA